MKSIEIVSEKYIDKSEVLTAILEIAKELGAEIITDKENLYLDNADLDLYFNPGEESVLLDIHILEEKEFKLDHVIVNSKDYYLALSIVYVSGSESYLSEFMKRFMAKYPNMLMDAGMMESFFTAEEIINGNVSW